MKTINQFIITVGILLCSLAVWADDAAEKASLEKYFSSRGTTYQDVIALAEENQALRDSVNTLYNNSFAIIDTADGEYIFHGYITLDGVAPDLGKKDSLYISKEAAAYLGEKKDSLLYFQFWSKKRQMMDELKKCLGTEAPIRRSTYIESADPIFGELPYRVEGINYAVSGGLTYLMQKIMWGDDVEICNCILNSDVLFKATTQFMEAFQNTDIYQNAKKKPLIYEVPLAKAKRLEYLSRDTLDYLHFVSLKEGGSVKMKKQGTPAEPALEYSKDNRKSWTNFDLANGTTFDHVGDTIWFRAGKNGVAGTNATISSSVQNYYQFVFGTNDSIAAGGNTMSLLDGTCELTTMPKNCFYCLFKDAKQLVSAPELPATQLAEGCYYQMFSGCTSLTQAPELMATTSADMCYCQMFSGCTSLQVDTCADDEACTGTLLITPSSGANWWNVDMFQGCHGAYANNIKLNSHYCIKEFIPDTIKGIELIAVDTIYDGQNHHITVNGTIAGDAVTYSTDSATWAQDTIKLKNVCEKNVFVRIQRTEHIDWFGKSYIKIAKKELTVDSVIVAEKVYDGNTQATITKSKLVGVVPGDSSIYLNATGDFENKNAGEDKNVSVSYSLIGFDIDNYTLQTTSETLKGTITPAILTVSGTSVDDKVYDGTTEMTELTAGNLVGIIGSDDVTISGTTAAFEDKNAGEDKDVVIQYNVTGNDANNYTVQPDTLQANITPKPLTISGTTVADKTYDGMFDAVVDTLGIVEGIVTGDSVFLTTTAFFSDRNAGDKKEVSVEYSVEGEGYTNYQAPQADYLSANINKRPITITSGSAVKVFNNLPLTNNQVEITEGSWVDDEGAELNATGSQTQIGTSPNTFTISYNEGTSESNYNITKVEGTLTVKDYGTCAEANATPKGEELGLKPVVVTYVSGAYTYVKDATGASLIYVSKGYGLKAGQSVTGFIGKSAPDAYAMPRIIPRKDTAELTIVSGPAPEPETRVVTPTTADIHQYVRYENITIDAERLTPAESVQATLSNTDKITLNSRFGRTFVLDKKLHYDIIAIVGSKNGEVELYPTTLSVHIDTAIDEVHDSQCTMHSVEKFIQDGKLYIRVDGIVYNANGVRVQ